MMSLTTEERARKLLEQVIEEVAKPLQSDVTMHKDIATDLRRRVIKLHEYIEHLADTVHKAHHQEQPGTWRECKWPLCANAAELVDEDYYE